MLGMHGARYTNYVLEEADLLICVGARFDDRAIGKTAEFCPNAKIIHIDIDRSELHKVKERPRGHRRRRGQVLRAAAAVKPQLRKRWLSHVESLKGRFPLAMPGIDNPRSPYGLIHAVANCLDDSAIITSDVGQHQMWVAQAYPFRRPASGSTPAASAPWASASRRPSARRWRRPIAPWCASRVTAA
jgi:acetolactate synthase-1/2/3 large subunit